MEKYRNIEKQILLEKIYADNKSRTYFHKGDLDVYGFLILENLKEKTGIPFIPFMMDVATIERFYKAGLYKEFTMEWENPEFMDFLMGALPKIRRIQDDKNIANELVMLERVLATYNSFMSDKVSFLTEVGNMITLILEKKDSWYGLNIYEIERYLKIHDFCLISGEGGIGKSYFIKCFEEQLEKNCIEHLCLYGKFEKDTSRIDIDEINNASEEGFVFICDAINEMSEEGQRSLYFTTLNDRADRRDEEAFYFALLCCAAPNKDVRCLAMKLLYEVVSKNDGYVEKLISEYDKLLDLYIQEAVIYVLSQIKKGSEKIVEFYNDIIITQEDLTAKSIRRIASYIGLPYSFIMWNRKDLYMFERNAEVSDLSWETQEKEKVILCNNNKNSYYRDPIGGTVFIRKDYYDKFVQSHTLKYFAFAERLIPETGFADETSLHFEIIDGCIVKEIRNGGGHGGWNHSNNPLCKNCPHADIIETKHAESIEMDMEWLENLLKKYGIDDDSDLIGDEEMLFICYPKCSTCQKAKKWLEEHNIEYTERHIVDANPTYDELKEWYKKSGLSLKTFFNTSGLLYKEMQLKDKLPIMSEEEQLKLLATNGMLVKRPLVVKDDIVLVGFKEVEWTEKLN